jgi:hypothetical protein
MFCRIRRLNIRAKDQCADVEAYQKQMALIKILFLYETKDIWRLIKTKASYSEMYKKQKAILFL